MMITLLLGRPASAIEDGHYLCQLFHVRVEFSCSLWRQYASY